MSSTANLTNAKYIDIFDEKLKSYNNIFFKTLQDDGLLNEIDDIKNASNNLNIPTDASSSYSTSQFNNFIRKIINFDIKNYDGLGVTGTNLEFVNKASASSSSQYTFNDNVGNNIIDTLKILNVFVDILEAYKHCIDKDIDTINTGYFNDIVIDRIEVVSSGTRFYTSGSATPVPDINTYKNVGYIRNTRVSTSATANNVLYLSIQSFYTGFTNANYNTIFDKKNISGNYSASEAFDKITMQIFNVSDTPNATPPIQGLELVNKGYARHFYDNTIPQITKSGLTREERNKNVVSLLLKCLFNIDPKYRKQSVYALYYYYKFVQLYATLIINVSNVMYAKGNNATQTTAPCIDTYNTGATYSVTAIEVTRDGIGYIDNSVNTLTFTGGGGAAASVTANSTGGINAQSVLTITNYGAGYTSAPSVLSDSNVPPTKKATERGTSSTSAKKKFEIALGASTTATDMFNAANNAANIKGATSHYTDITNNEPKLTTLNNLIDSKITGIGNEINIDGDYIAYNGATLTDATIIGLTKGLGASQISSAENKYDDYTLLLIDKRKKLLIKNEKNRLLELARTKNEETEAYENDRTAEYKSTIVPLAFKNISKVHSTNIDRLKVVIDDIENKITSLITEIKSVAIDVNYEELVILTNNVDAKINKSANNNVVIMIASTGSTSPNNVNNPIIYKLLKKYNENSSFIKDYSVYDKKNKIYYDIVSINDTLTYFEIEIKAVFVYDASKPSFKEFYNYDSTLYGSYNSGISTSITTQGDFLQIKKKDINGFKNNYVENKEAVDKLNENISLNTNRVNNQKNLYETQYNKNVFLSRQILTYNILICTIIVVLIGINVFKIDKPLVKSISLACLGIIILLFIIYFMSNITYIETFVVVSADISSLKSETNKITILENNIHKLNAQFIRYFETITILLPTSDSVDFYKEITSVINADIENKTYLDKILDFNSSQGNTNMDTLKYELENNKLYILTLLISSIIFIGLYNIYINYINDDKYLSLMIFIAIIIFIVIGAYYIINSNRRVRTIHKNIYWGPQSSESF